MQIFVAGTWRDEKAKPFKNEALLLGKLIAKSNYDLACGPGTGIARYVIDGYRSVQPRGKVLFYLPDRKEMEKVGEIIGEGADEIINTDFDYPMRNLYQIKASDALIIITGGDGSLEEAIAALVDYNLPVAGLENSGTAVKALELLSDIYTDWQKQLLINNDIHVLLEHIKHKLSE